MSHTSPCISFVGDVRKKRWQKIVKSVTFIDRDRPLRVGAALIAGKNVDGHTGLPVGWIVNHGKVSV